MTEEEMRAEIVRLTEQVTALVTEKSTLSSELSTTKTRIADLQEHNQKLFLKITQPEKKKEEETKESIEEFAKKLKF